MILAIDCGNTHITLGVPSCTETPAPILRIPTDRHETDFGYAAKIRGVLALRGIDPQTLDGAVLSSVVPPLTGVLQSALRMLTQSDPLTVGAGVKTGLHLAVNDPGTVASDLVALAVAAKEEYPLPCVVIDMGTATTMTVVDAQGRYVGGSILPGAALSLNALAEQAALLPHIELSAPRRAISVTTVDCMKSGTVFGAAGAVDALLDRFEQELEAPIASVVGTGILAPAILPHCRRTVLQDESLLLKGLWQIWQKNQKERKAERA